MTGQPPPASGPSPGARLRSATRTLAVASGGLLLIAGGVVVVGYVLGKLWPVLLPVVMGLLVTTVLWPAARFLRRHHWRPALAAGTVVLVFLAVLAGVVALIAPPVVDQVGTLADQATSGLQQVRDWLQGPPLNLGAEQVGNAVDSVINSVQNNAQTIAGYALTGATAIGSGLVNVTLALVLSFFFLKDGPRFLPWLSAQLGSRAAPHVTALSERTWQTLSEFIRQQAFVGFIDAFFIGLGLLVLGVPLVLPLAVLTFFAAFVPIVGAFVAGAFAVLVALVANGFTTALIVLAIVVVVQQLEGNVLQPYIQGRGLNLHAAVVILAVTAGGSLAGITGAFLAVPVAALVAVVYRYGRDELQDGSAGPDARAPAPPEPEATAEPAAPAPTGEAPGD